MRQAGKMLWGLFTAAIILIYSVNTHAAIYIHDELGRLKTVVYSSGKTAIYSYDAAGNLITTSMTIPNAAPVITEGTSIAISMSKNGSPTLFSLTLHASDTNSDILTWSISGAATHGTATASGIGNSKAINYIPTMGYAGPDSFVVSVGDAHGGTANMTVNVTVTPTYTVSTSVTGSNGTVICTSPVNSSATSTCTITPATGYQLATFTDNSIDLKGLVTGGSYSIANIAADHVIAATFSDSQSPVVTDFKIPVTGTSLTVSISNLTATDNVNVTGYCLAEANSSSACTWSVTAPSNYNFTTGGSQTLYAFARDAAGNISNNKSATTTITLIDDTTAPQLTLSMLADGAITNNATLNISGTANDNTALASLFLNNQMITVQFGGSFSAVHNLSGGNNLITVTATDSAGNSTTLTRTITLDQNAPLLTVTTPVDNSATASAQTTITGSCGDASSITVKVNNNTLQGATITSGTYNLTVSLPEGQNTLIVTAIDAVGNSSSVARTVTYDATAPSVAITIPDADMTVQILPYTITGSVEDALTDVSLTMTVNGQSVTPTINGALFTYQLDDLQEGANQVVVTAKDLLNNTALVTRNLIYAPYADLNNDGDTTAADALLVLQMAIGLRSDDLRADVAPLVNGISVPDGKVTAADALVILRKVVGLW